MEPLFLRPTFQAKIWGGRRLVTDFGYQLPAGKAIGEAWIISGHPHGPSPIANGPYQGKLLSDLWQEQPDLFGQPAGKVFPILTKILDAEASLSVQVHPDNAYAWCHEHELGKTECWYIISADPGSYLIYGHHAQTQAQLETMIDQGDWDHLLRKLPVKTGDFVYVPSGTVHALNKGIVALETQQSSDTTYRLYDYDRVNQQSGQKRALHLQQSKDTITVPFVAPKLTTRVQKLGKSQIISYVQPPQAPFFAVWRLDINHDSLTLRHQLGAYTLYSVIAGQGELQIASSHYPLNLGTSFIIPAPIKEWQIQGEGLQLIASESTEK
ncbi:class I mannose-6-phosphate isomerase [Lactobacillus sp. DCY120]|uniref:Mannose-6-phosphate isomerase n=1 Tax=Bombilactobacillus apium TaxID=2675299 RepID=A0A850R969_9LACO|nr:type I phosphomannose isomerase catalytic subunit [Bombilactobacillus apium]NVY95946.1 class I mannose-6-phosphate isomerase [Bombilactobacillus apium]